MPEVATQSLLFRLGLALALLTALASVGLLSSVFIADAAQGGADAVNQSGSLRMLSYRIAARLTHGAPANPAERRRITALANEFAARLTHPPLSAVVAKSDSHNVATTYARVTRRWQQQIRPLLAAYGRDGQEAQAQRYLAVVDGFVTDIDQMVQALASDAEAKISHLRLIQAVTLLLILAVVGTTLYVANRRVRVPLHDLLRGAERARRGDFSHRSRHTGPDELGRLGHAFNVMAEDLSKLYSHLEARVAEKTADLERSNHSLELLYATAHRLGSRRVDESTYGELLSDLERLLGVRHGTLCLADPEALAAGGAEYRRQIGEPCSDCAYCDGQFDGGVSSAENRVRVAVRGRRHTYGALSVETSAPLAPWQSRLLEAVAQHIGIAIDVDRRERESRRLALFEERTVIARELHDSLAQALAYLKIQAARLEAEVRRETPQATTLPPIIGQLRDGISDAYRQLRELLTTFRLRMDDRGLNAALADAAQEFGRRGSLGVVLDNRLPGDLLGAHQEIHLLQVVREALANALHHAHATHAWIRVTRNDMGTVEVTVDDDGIGLAAEPERPGHYGLASMRERASGLGGHLALTASPKGGTRVHLSFRPDPSPDATEPPP